MTIPEQLAAAIQHHATGNLSEAEMLYRQIISQQPNHPDALHLLGVLAAQVGRADTAIDLIDRAIAINPNIPDYHNNRGNALRNLSRHDDAIAAYEQAIVLRSDYAEAYCNMAISFIEKARLPAALDACRRAIELKPDFAKAHRQLGIALSVGGDIDGAIAAFRQAVRIQSDYVDAHHDLAMALKNKGFLLEAIAAFQIAALLKPSDAFIQNNLGNTFWKIGNVDDAIAAYQRALELKPDFAEACNNLGNPLKQKGMTENAITAYRHALHLKPDYFEALCNLGNTLKETGQLDDAIRTYRDALLLRDDFAEAHHDLGVCLTGKGQLDEAIASHRRALDLKPHFAQAHYNLSIAQRRNNQHDAADDSCRRAIAIQPDLVDAHIALAGSLLQQGNFEQGWKEHEWRWRAKDFPVKLPKFRQPLWNGEPLAGRTIFIYAEQGFGDTIQFVRLIPLVAARGGKVILAAPKELLPLLTNFPHIDQLVNEPPWPPFDLHCPLLSLPLKLNIRLESIPRDTPYLNTDALHIEAWRKKLAPADPRLKVGLAWAGNPSQVNNQYRSMTLSQFSPLGKVSNVVFYSLQKGITAAETKNTPQGMELIDFSQELENFADTAALISHMDLIITVDTSVAHLAGAMAKPVWVLLSTKTDWRWLLDREDSPWYPTMRLFRQRHLGDWAEVAERVAESLAAYPRA